jgi:hypothetical protein
VTGATTTNGITNSGNVTTDTLTTTGNATVGGALNANGGLTVDSGKAVSMGGNVVHDVATPVAATDAANKAYVDSLAGETQTELGTVQAGLNDAFKKIDENTQGIAIAMAMGGLSLPSGKNFAVGADLGFYQDKQAAAAQFAARVNDAISLGTGLNGGGQVGGRVGISAAF